MVALPIQYHIIQHCQVVADQEEAARRLADLGSEGHGNLEGFRVWLHYVVLPLGTQWRLKRYGEGTGNWLGKIEAV